MAQDPMLAVYPQPSRVVAGRGRLRWQPEAWYRGDAGAMAARALAAALEAKGVALRLGKTAPGDVTTIRAQKLSTLKPAEWYRLRVDEAHGVLIEHSDEAGLRWALQTLAQLIESGEEALACVEIEDAPAFAVRGLMLDVSRDRVPTFAALCALVDQMEKLKLNHLQLYTEHTYAYQGHDQVWEGSSPLTAEEVRGLARHCASRGVDLAANQNCLGHLQRWLTTPGYEALAEIQGIATEWEFETDDGRKISKVGPFSLCPIDPRSLALVSGLLKELLPLFPSRYANIGFDEAHDVGQGRSKEAVGLRGRDAVYLEFLRAVAKEASKAGKCSLFWADLALKGLREGTEEARKEIAARLREVGGSEGSIALVWSYESDAPFRKSCEMLCEAGVASWVCPGTSAWLSVTGRSRVRRGNLAAAGACADVAKGILITEWGDQGHRQVWPVSLLAIAHGAGVAWNPKAEFNANAAGSVVFGQANRELGAWIDELGEVGADLTERLGLRNRSALYDELHRNAGVADPTKHGFMDEWEAIDERLRDLRERLEAMNEGAALAGDVMWMEAELALRVAEHAATKAMVMRAPRTTADGRRAEIGGAALVRLAVEMAVIAEDHRELWLERNRPGGLDASAKWYEQLIADYERKPRRWAGSTR